MIELVSPLTVSFKLDVISPEDEIFCTCFDGLDFIITCDWFAPQVEVCKMIMYMMSLLGIISLSLSLGSCFI